MHAGSGQNVLMRQSLERVLSSRVVISSNYHTVQENRESRWRGLLLEGRRFTVQLSTFNVGRIMIGNRGLWAYQNRDRW